MDDFIADAELTDSMDKVRAICGIALSVRDKNGLRVRLPLRSMTVISADTKNLEKFSSVIKEEINLKSVDFSTKMEDFGEKKLVLNFQKIGAKVGDKMQSIIVASKKGEWQFNRNNKLEIEGFELNDDEYDISWVPKQDGVFVASDYDILIKPDLRITEDLEQEGIARDVTRAVQQCRKFAKLDVSDRIELFLWTTDNFMENAIASHKDYIQYQTLANRLEIEEKKSEFSFEEKIDEKTLRINFSRIL
jgi:isoleucyl-tRNA synthetase